MTYHQLRALNVVKADILLDAQGSNGAEYTEVDGLKFKRSLDGTLEALETGNFEILLTPDDEGTLNVEVVTDYGFCKATSYYGEIAKDGTITTE